MKTNYVLKILLFVFFLCLNGSANAESLPLPRFVSIRASMVNMRSGPGLRYPISWVYKQSGVPVEIIAEFDVWRKIRDFDGDEGWVNRSMLSGKRFFMAKDDIFLYQKDGKMLKKIAKIENGAIGSISECREKLDYCLVKIMGYEGIVKRKDIFGVYNYEVVK